MIIALSRALQDRNSSKLVIAHKGNQWTQNLKAVFSKLPTPISDQQALLQKIEKMNLLSTTYKFSTPQSSQDYRTCMLSTKTSSNKAN